MGALIFSLHYFTLFFFILLTLSASNEESHRHTMCTSSLVSCGNLQKIGYPFWGLGRPQYCGHPSLQLLCKNHLGRDYPALQIGEDKVHYLVLGIHNSSTNRTIQLQELNETCPFHSFKSFNKNFDKIFRFHFSETESVVNITLFYRCIGQMPDVPKCSIACWDNETTTYYLNTMPEAARFRSCKKVEVPVLNKQLDHLKKSNESLENVLNQGFKVDLLNFSACSMCQKAGGACGSSDDAEFACFFRKTRKLNHIVKLEISGAILVLITVNVGFWCCVKRKIYSSKLQPTRLPSVSMDFDLEIGSFYNKIPVFRYNELQEATDNFHESRKLGDGGFGSVYYGILRDGREVAAKRLYEKSSNQIDQFINEIEILTRLRHPNLVTLYGCTARNSRGLLLVYEFVPNGTVSDHLSGELRGSKTLSWDTRMKIATEIACALSYLHASDIIHRDVKTKNILLDNNFSVKVADFGLSRLFPCDVSHVSTVPQGSPGYLDPEYSKCYQLTSKSDVYSFGVVLVELISSLPAVDISRQKHEINLYDYAMNRIKDGILSELVDKKLGYESNFDVKVMINLVAELAFRCLQQEKELRPTMDEVLETLVQIGSANYKALETENKSPSIAVSKSASSTEENDMKPPLKNTQHRRSPNSVIVNYDSSKEDFKHTD